MFFTTKSDPIYKELRIYSNIKIYRKTTHGNIPNSLSMKPSLQLLPQSHTATNQSRTTNNIDVYLYKKNHYNANLTKTTKRKEIRTNLYLFQFHIALKIDLGGSDKKD